METTLIGQKRHSGMQEMGETREPMAAACWKDAHRFAEAYDKALQRDFWVMFAAKPSNTYERAAVMGWRMAIKRPPRAMVGVMVFKWSHADQQLTVETDLSLPYDIPLSDAELSTSAGDFVPTIAAAAKKSESILLA